MEDPNTMAIIIIITIIIMNIDPMVAGLAELLVAGSVELLGAGLLAVLLEDFLVELLLVVAASQDRKVVSKSFGVMPELTKIKFHHYSV